jgi:hypothetical protein
MASRLFHILTILGSIAGGFTLLDTYNRAESAPQQAAGAAIAIALTIIPYCFARACTLMVGESVCKLARV